ncbi:putative lipoprotein [Paraburkholderia sp. GAS41]|jgi:hypothetical protein|uniref:hypothetical protein n=1 Tax=Paraburkholderia sp. GAS41 TaxID=3035134 RepID=UPI003D232296
MKRFCFAAVLVLLTTACSSTGSPANTQPDTDTYILHTPNVTIPADATSRPPRLTVGVSDPNTQLILPWFLNDIINLVNYR